MPPTATVQCLGNSGSDQFTHEHRIEKGARYWLSPIQASTCLDTHQDGDRAQVDVWGGKEEKKTTTWVEDENVT